MKPLYREDIGGLSEILNNIERDNNVKSSLLLISDKTPFEKNKLDTQLRSLKKTVIGGIFPGLIYENECKFNGFILIPLAFNLETTQFNLNNDEAAYNAQLNKLKSIGKSKSILIFYDAMDMKKSPLIDYLFNFFGISLSYFGAGCGKLNFEPSPCVISNQGISENTCVIGLTPEPFVMSMSRSWEPISVQMKVSEVEKNSIKSLNWEPAVNIYKSLIENHLEKNIEVSEIPDLLKSYPIGLVKIDGDIVVRDPFAIRDNEILFFDSVQPGEYVSILHGNKSSILTGAQKALENMVEAVKTKKMEEPEFIFGVNCISRVLFLKEDHNKELDILNAYKPIYGVLSIGEIINPGNTILEIFNKILAIATWKPKI